MTERRTLLVAACALLGAGAGFAAGTFGPARFTAQAQLILDATEARAADAGPTDVEADAGERVPGAPERSGDALATQVENQVRVLTSESVLRRLIAAQRLDEDPEFDGSPASGSLARIADGVLEVLGAGEPKAATPTRSAVRILRRSVFAQREPRSTVVSVSVAARDPHKAMVLTDGLVAAYVAEAADAREASGTKAAAAFDGRIAEARSALEQAERRAGEEKRRDADPAGREAGERQLASASERLDRARTAAAQAAAAHQQVLKAQRAGEPGLVPEALRSTLLDERRTQLAEVLRRMADLTATRGPRHPDVIEIKAREAAIRRPLAEEIARIAGLARAASERARTDERQAEKTLDGLKTAADAKVETAPRLRELDRDAAAARTLYEAVLARSRTSVEREKAGTADIRVISNASLPEQRVSPPPTPILILVGLVSGLVLGLILDLVADRMHGLRRGGREPRRPPPSPGRALVRD